MNIISLKAKAKDTLEEYLLSRPAKNYFSCLIWDMASQKYFDELDEPHRGWVYVIFDDDKKRVKIGHTVRNPVERARRIFPFCGGTKLYVSAFPCKMSDANKVEGYIQSILYSCGLQSYKRGIGNAEAHSGATEIFDINPSIACAMIDEATTEWVIS